MIISIPVKSILIDNKPLINNIDQSGYVNENMNTGTTETPIMIFGILIAFVLPRCVIPVPTNPAPWIIINKIISESELVEVSVKNLTKSPIAMPITPMQISIDFVVLDSSLFKIPFNMLTIPITNTAIPGYMTKMGEGLVMLKKR